MQDRYKEFLRCSREYQHLKMIQRSGRVFETMTGATLNDGDLAVECPACPHPGRNLPDDWMSRIDMCVISFIPRILLKI